jgi:hypothetical protein
VCRDTASVVARVAGNRAVIISRVEVSVSWVDVRAQGALPPGVGAGVTRVSIPVLELTLSEGLIFPPQLLGVEGAYFFGKLGSALISRIC